MPTPTWIDGFEHGTALDDATGTGLLNNIANNSGTYAVESGAARSGGFGLRMNQATNGNAVKLRLHQVSAQTLVGSFYWRATLKPTTQRTDIFTFEMASGTTVPGFWYNPSTDKIEAANWNGTIITNIQSPSGTVTLNQWYRIDFKIVTSGTTWTIDWYVDGVLQTQVSISGQSAINVNRTTVSTETVASTDAVGCVWNFDDFVFSNTAADFPLGEYKIVGVTADQTVAAAHQGITTTQWDTTPDFSAFTNFTGQTETTSRGFLDDLNKTDGIRMNLTTAIAGNARWPVSDPSTPVRGTPVAVSLITASREGGVTGTSNAIFRSLMQWASNVAFIDSNNVGIIFATAAQFKAGATGTPTATAGTTSTSLASMIAVKSAVVGIPPTVVDTSTAQAAGTPLTLSVPAAVVDGDLMVAMVRVVGTSHIPSTPAGWTALDNNVAGPSVQTYYKLASSEPASYNFTATSGNALVGAIIAIRGADQTTPIDQHGALNVLTATTAITSGTVTSTVDGALLVFAGTHGNTSGSLTIPGQTVDHFNADPAWGTTWNFLRSIMTTKPSGGAWDVAAVQGINFEADSTDASPNPWLSGFYYQIAYSIAPPKSLVFNSRTNRNTLVRR